MSRPTESDRCGNAGASHTRNHTRHRQILGREGEDRAAAFLRARGYRIVERNVRYDGVEIDLLVRRGGTAIFVEVKTRSSGTMGPPELAVDARKQARMVRAARAWLLANPRGSRSIRFDVVSCRVNGHGPRRRWQLEHLPDAFQAKD